MNRTDRVAADRRFLKEQGYKKIKLINMFDYYKDHEKAVSVYMAKLGKEKHFKYFFPNELNPDTIWDELINDIPQEILSYHMDFKQSGLIYNVLVNDNDNKKLLLINFNPIDRSYILKEAEFDG